MSFTVTSVQIDSSYLPLFHIPQPIIINAGVRNDSSLQWLGADVATSIALNRRKIWLFGDTLLGKVDTTTKSRVIRAMPRNSIAIQAGDDDLSQLQFYTRVNYSSLHDPHVGFFSPPNASHWLWLTSAFELHDQLFLLGVTVAPDVNGMPGFDFQFVDTVVVRVVNPLDDPARWNWTITSIPNTNATDNWNTAVAVDKQSDRVYLLGRRGAFGTTMLASLSANDAMLDNWQSLTIISDSVISAFGPPETSLLFINKWQRWAFLHVPFGTADLVLYISPSTSLDDNGAWTSQTIWSLPPPFANYPAVFVYAPKFHQTNDSSTLIATLCSNTPKIQSLVKELEIYVPLPIAIKI